MEAQQCGHLLALVTYSLKPVKLLGPCKRTQHCWPTTPNIVGSCWHLLRPFAWALRAPAKPTANIKQVLISNIEAFGLLYFVKIKSMSSLSIGFLTFVGLKPNNLLDVSTVCRTNEWSVGDTGQFMSPSNAVQGSCNRCRILTRINFIPNIQGYIQWRNRK